MKFLIKKHIYAYKNRQKILFALFFRPKTHDYRRIFIIFAPNIY